MKSAWRINNISVPSPVNEKGIQVMADFTAAKNTASITTNKVEFANKGAEVINSYVDGGLDGSSRGAFHGLPVTVQVTNNEGDYINAFDGFIDFKKDHRIGGFYPSVKVELSLKKGLIAFEHVASGLSFGWLLEMGTNQFLGFTERAGAIAQSDLVTLPYVYAPVYDDLAGAVFALSTLTISIELIQIIQDVINLVSLGTSPATWAVVGMIAALGSKIATLVIRIEEYITSTLPLVIHEKRYRKAISYRKMMEKGCEYCGLNFSSSIEELDNVYYYASRREDGSNYFDFTDGDVFSSNDQGYIFSEFVDLMKEMFDADCVIINGTLHLEPLINDSFWLIHQSDLDINNIDQPNEEGYRLNVDEVVGVTYVEFITDETDVYTLDDNKDRLYEAQTISTFTDSEPLETALTGSNKVSIPHSLGSRKDELTPFEQILLNFLEIVDSVTLEIQNAINEAINVLNDAIEVINDIIDFMGTFFDDIPTITLIDPVSIATNYADDYAFSVIGVLKQSERLNNKPKSLYLLPTGDGYRMPSDHRDKWSAKTLYTKYIKNKSFVSNGFRNQYKVYNGIRIPMGLKRFIEITNNSYFKYKGKKAKITSLKWNFLSDEAVIDFRVKDKYSTNVQEKFNFITG